MRAHQVICLYRALLHATGPRKPFLGLRLARQTAVVNLEVSRCEQDEIGRRLVPRTLRRSRGSD